MPTEEYAELYYKKFGVKQYHDHNVYGTGVSVYIIDMGLASTEQGLRNVRSRTVVNPMARRSHGSFVASIIGYSGYASGSGRPDGTRLDRQDAPRSKAIGIAPDAQLYLADVSDAAGHIYTSTLVKAIQDAVDLNVDIISISLGTSVYDERLERVVNDAAKKGILVFAAAGNCSCRTYEFPAACQSAISVASIDSQRRLSPFNTRNDSVAVFAPGQNIKVPGSSRLSGTSFAVPFASGLAALELSRRRLTDPNHIMTRQDAIMFLRGTLGLDCSVHTYSTDVCTEKFAGGSFAPEDERPKVFFLVCFVVFMVFLIAEKLRLIKK